MMKNKSDLTITEIDDIYQSMSAAELWQHGKGVESLQIRHIDPVLFPKSIRSLSIEQTSEYIQSLSICELKALWKNSTPVKLNYSTEEIETSEKIWAIMDLTDLDYESVEKILFEPKRAALGDIAIYCKGLNIDFLAFIGKALA